MKKNDYLPILNLSLLIIFIYIVTNYYATKTYSFYVFIFFVIYSLSAFIFKRQNSIKIYSLTISVLLLVGVTGWFQSPFLSYLYIMAIALAFLFNPLTSSFFVVTLMGIFLFRAESTDVVIDLMTLFSIFLIIPLSRFLRSEYLKQKEEEKQILILKERDKKFTNVVVNTLNNKVTKMAVDLKQPLNDIKMIAHIAKRDKNASQSQQEEKIISLAEEALKTLKQFETKSTGLKLAETPNT